MVDNKKDTGFYVFQAKRCSSWKDAGGVAEKTYQVNIMHAHEVFGHLGETALQAIFAAKGIRLTGQFHCNACCAVNGTKKPTKKLATEVITTPNKIP